MKRFRTYIFVILIPLIQSCASHQYALNPVGGNTTWSPSNDSVVVLVGFNSDKPIAGMTGGSIPTFLFNLDTLNVAAIHRKVNEPFKLEQVTFLGGLNQTLVGKFENTHALKFTKPGIYYYGYVVVRDKEVRLNAKYNEDVIGTAKKQYGYVFELLEPVNF